MKRWERLAKSSHPDTQRDAAAEASEMLLRFGAEVTDVLRMLDGLARYWGDEGALRICRDRLRELVEEDA